MPRENPEAISPTAHYTGYVWYAHGYSHDAFATRAGRVMYTALRSANVIAQRVGLPSLEGMLLARHRLIDLQLRRAIDAGELHQIVEVAAGLSPRGWRFARHYGDRITYVEADLPGMIAHKRRILAALGGESPHHRTVEVNALAERGATSITEVCAALDPSRGTAIVTEGLINYFDRDTVAGMWRRFGEALHRFPRGRYVSDLMLGDDNRSAVSLGFSWLLSAFVRGRVHLPFATRADAEQALARAELTGSLLDPRDFTSELDGLELAGAGRVRIIDATA